MARAHNNRPASTSGSKPRGGSATTGYGAELWRMTAVSVDVLFAHSSAVLVWCLTNTVMKMRGHLKSVRHMCRVDNRKRICETPH